MKNLKRLLKLLKNLLLGFLVILCLVLLVIFAKPLWHRFVTYPKFQKQVEAFQQRKKEVQLPTSLKIYRGYSFQ